MIHSESRSPITKVSISFGFVPLPASCQESTRNFFDSSFQQCLALPTRLRPLGRSFWSSPNNKCLQRYISAEEAMATSGAAGDAQTPDELVGLTPEQAEQLRAEWSRELARVEDEIATLRTVLQSKVIFTSNNIQPPIPLASRIRIRHARKINWGPGGNLL